MEKDNEPEITWTPGNYKVTMDVELDKKLKYMSNNYPHEIAGWLTGIKNEDGSGYHIKDILIPEQEVCSASVDIDAAAGPALLRQFGEKCQEIIGHWHSHCKMGTFWSGTDETAMKKLSTPREGYLFIVSSRNVHKCRVYIHHALDIMVDNIPVDIVGDDDDYEEIKKIIEEKVIEKKNNMTHYSKIIHNNGAYGNRNYRESNLTPLRKIDEELLMGVRAVYEDRMLTISGLQQEEGNELLEEYKSFDPSIEMDGLLCNFKVRLKKLELATKVIDNVRNMLITCAGDFMQSCDYDMEQEIMGAS